MTFPSADHIAVAIVTAARAASENPLEVVGGASPMPDISPWKR